jgi:integrase
VRDFLGKLQKIPWRSDGHRASSSMWTDETQRFPSVKHAEGKGGRLLHTPPPEDRAELLRADLRTVGVARPALFIEGDPAQRGITFHDLRDTGLTHMAVRGDSPIVVQWAGGHTDFKTTQGYLDRGRVERQRIGQPLPVLPASLLSPPEKPGSKPGSGIQGSLTPLYFSVDSATPTGIELYL